MEPGIRKMDPGRAKWSPKAGKWSPESRRLRGARAGCTKTGPHTGQVQQCPLLKYINRQETRRWRAAKSASEGTHAKTTEKKYGGIDKNNTQFRIDSTDCVVRINNETKKQA